MKKYSVESIEFQPESWGHSKVKIRKRDYSTTPRKYFQKIMEDEDRLEHWTEIVNELKKIDTNLLRFIVEKKCR